MFSNFFIKRPIFAIVCTLIIVFLGIVVVPTLPIARFPSISPVQVVITSNYVGADAETVETGVTNILEQEINGIEGVRYISSTSGSDGTSQITVTFASNVDPNIATVNVQNRVARVEPQLPESVIQTGVTVNQQNSNFLNAIAIYADNGEYDPLFMSNYADTFMVEALRRIDGVGDIQIFGERRYAMRLWLDPNRLASRNLTVQDVANAIREQNIQVGAGAIGQQPTSEEQEYQLNLRAVSRLRSVEEFENLVLSTGDAGSLVRVRDVGRVELGAENYSSFLTYNGREAIGLGILQRPGTNALETAQAVQAELERLKESFPPGLNYAVAFDTTTFVSISLREVVVTLLTAILLVVIILYLFLQDWRTTLIPALAIPISLIGTFIFTRIFGFSLNTLTLFGLTLVTGVVVDDAIVVTEAIAAKVQDQGIPPVKAAVEAMRELAGAVIATSLVLMAVFIPVAFFPGTTGAIYRQFALTIAFAIVVSTFNALTFSPALGALLLRQRPENRNFLGRLFAKFNQGLDWVRQRYRGSLNFLVRLKYLVLAVFVALLLFTGWLYRTVPSGFLPEEDQGYFITIVQAPEGVSLNYTKRILDQVDAIVRQQPEVASNFAVTGFSFAGSAPNQGIMFTLLKPWEDRSGADQNVQGIIGRVQPQFFGIPQGRIFALVPPSIEGLGNYGGFQMELQDRRGNLSLDQFVGSMYQFIGAANQNPNLEGVFSTYTANTPQLLVEVNRDRAKALNVNIDDIFSTLQSFLGSQYVNDFTLEQDTYRVYLQADEQFRSNPESIRQFYVRAQGQNGEPGQMVQLGNLVTLTPTTSAQTITHYNLFRSISIQGNAAPGSSSGQALRAMEETAAQVLPAGLGYEWTGTALEEIESGGQAPIIFGLGLIMVFLVLAAQYESFFDPVIILFSVPLAILGALLAVFLRGFANDVYCQIGLVMLIGLASKNAILIVEYANQLRDEGLSTVQAAIEASQERLRPILMTAISSVIGFFPLVIAVGAGAESRQSLGTALVGGFFVATFLSLFVVPMLYIITKNISDRFFPPNKDRQAQVRELTESGVFK
ncbi:efflux RND transporter permease subunit [Thermocoleostomius sinensis]|uniref:Efflux RND transporter permease subunit n=1 Tax=Thermocoleostomius sinensis A174 TaxID=2016057 RepID=A0A9E9CBD9_9CYAN|nr:efflux RND transporter permease subunit [Thermocoleostomius sinensis]WAL60380.1 efflux RND transporter permease subunit [Thermocoleostomius sinensis A174]